MPFSDVLSCSCSGQSGTLMVFGAWIHLKNLSGVWRVHDEMVMMLKRI